MANGYDSHSLDATGLSEAASSSSVPMSQMMPVAVRDKRYTRNGIGYRTQEAALNSENPGGVNQNPPPIMYPDGGYPGGTAGRTRGRVDESKMPWDTAQEATAPQIRPRDTLERFSMNEALPPWLRDREDDEEKESAAGIQENEMYGHEHMDGFPCEADARMALAVLSQFVDGETAQAVQDAIEGQFGDPAEREEMPGEPGTHVMPDGSVMDDDDMYESGLKEAPLDAKKRNALPNSAFALPGRRYPIDSPERARSALARVEQFGSADEKRRVRAAVKRKYPNMDVE